ncbi:hypothetical protein K1719_012125 [Acacia pycnantha]|nr:hypothetical protein K1719_012125 [Acacia pycnantha]
MMDTLVEAADSPHSEAPAEIQVPATEPLDSVPETQMAVDHHPVQDAQMNIDDRIKIPSFKDKLLNSDSIVPEDDEDDLNLSQDDVSFGLSGNIPITVNFVSHILETLNKKMGLTVVIKLLGRKIGCRQLRSQLQNIWKPAGQAKLIDLEDDCFLVKFQDDLDYQHALLTGPWVIFGHYLTVQPWSPAFKPQNHVINQIMGWIRLPKLPTRYYHKNVIRSIASVFGEVIKVDYNTDSGDRAKFARIAVMIDLAKPLISKILVDGELIFVEYEGLPSICFNCGRYGHLQQACPLNQTAASEDQSEISPALVPNAPPKDPEARETSQYGAWMQVQPRRRAIVRGDKSSAPHGNKRMTGVSRFEILSEMPEEERPAVYESVKENLYPNDNSFVQRKKGAESKGSKKTSTGNRQKVAKVQSTNKDSIFNSKHYVAMKTTSTLDPNNNVAIQVIDPRLPLRPSEACGPSNRAITVDPLSKSRGIKLATGVSIHNLGAKPFPDLVGPSIRLMKHLARGIQAEIGVEGVVESRERDKPVLGSSKLLKSPIVSSESGTKEVVVEKEPLNLDTDGKCPLVIREPSLEPSFETELKEQVAEVKEREHTTINVFFDQPVILKQTTHDYNLRPNGLSSMRNKKKATRAHSVIFGSIKTIESPELSEQKVQVGGKKKSCKEKETVPDIVDSSTTTNLIEVVVRGEEDSDVLPSSLPPIKLLERIAHDAVFTEGQESLVAETQFELRQEPEGGLAR